METQPGERLTDVSITNFSYRISPWIDLISEPIGIPTCIEIFVVLKQGLST